MPKEAQPGGSPAHLIFPMLGWRSISKETIMTQNDVTQALVELSDGDPQALERLLPMGL